MGDCESKPFSAARISYQTWLPQQKTLNPSGHSVVYESVNEALALQELFYAVASDLEVDFGHEENASIVYAALAVDMELQPDKVKRIMAASNGKLSVHFEATEARFLRASFSAFVDVLTLATKTIEEFGPALEL